ncbi:hypothetical protein [Pseudomonas sp. TSRC2-2]|uniref:hypothetical protein n=1 Tax=unclassified Pseudomonas TaxID=196821 RepID=UPI003CEAE093
MRPTVAADKDENVFLGGFAIHGHLQIERDHAPAGNTPPQVEFLNGQLLMFNRDEVFSTTNAKVSWLKIIEFAPWVTSF